MSVRNMLSYVLLIAAVFSWPGPASTAERMIPFEDPATHQWGYKNNAGQVMIAPRFAAANDFSAHGIAAVADQTGWMYIDGTGAVLIRPLPFDNGPDYFSDGLARFTEAGKVGFFDKRGRVSIGARFDFALPFSEGLAAFCQGCSQRQEGEHRSVAGGTWGFIDKKGTIVIAPRFTKAEPFKQGRARVLQQSGWAFIDTHGALVQ